MGNSTPEKRPFCWLVVGKEPDRDRASKWQRPKWRRTKNVYFHAFGVSFAFAQIKYEKMLKWERKVRKKKTRRKYGYCRSDERKRERNSKRFARDKNYRKLSNVLGLAAICMPFVLTCMRYASVVRCGDATWCLPYMQLQVATHAHNGTQGASYTKASPAMLSHLLGGDAEK